MQSNLEPAEAETNVRSGLHAQGGSIRIATAERYDGAPQEGSHASQDIVLFDGQCNFCRQQISHLRRLDGRDRLRYVSLHEPWVANAFPDLTHEQLMEQMWVIAPDGARYGGASALKYLSRRLPILWPIVPALHFPGTMPLWNWMYRQVAKRRYRIAGRHCDDGSCSLHGK